MGKIKVLMITPEWPDKDRPSAVPFLVRQVELLKNRNIDIDVFPFRGARNPINYLRAASLVRRKMRDAHFDLIHAQWGQSALPVLFAKKPLVTTFRGSDLFGITGKDGKYTWSGKALALASKLVALRSKAVVLVSSRMAPLLFFKRSYHLIPCGVNFDVFKPSSQHQARQRLNLPASKKIVLFGGDPSRSDKRFFLAKKAMDVLASKMEVELLIAKNVAHTDMPTYYQAADVLLLTSMHEGSPNVVKEALACNTAVVSVDVGDVRERIHNLPACFICENEDPTAIANQLKQSLEFTGEKNYRNFIQELDENLLADKQVEVYKKLTNRR